MTLEDASEEADYPPEIWQQAQAQWNDLGPDGQQERKDQIGAVFNELAQRMTPGFFETFSLWDLLWFALAAITAFRIAAGAFDAD